MSDPVTSPTPRRKPPPLLPVLLTAALAAACGGPAATLHDVLDEAEDRVNHVLAAFEETEGEMNEVIGAELPACPPALRAPAALDRTATLRGCRRTAGATQGPR